MRLDPNNPRHKPIIEWVDGLPHSGRGKESLYHIEAAMIAYVKKQPKTRLNKISSPVSTNDDHKTTPLKIGNERPSKEKKEPAIIATEEPIITIVAVEKEKKGAMSDKYKNFLNDTDFG